MSIDTYKTAEQLLDDGVFRSLLSTKSPVERTRFELNLLDRAKQFGIESKFKALLKAYKEELSNGIEIKGQSADNYRKDDIKYVLHKFSKDGQITGIKDKAICQYIMGNYHIFVISGNPYIYDGGVYKADINETKLKAIIQDLIYDDYLTIDAVNRIYRLIIAQDGLQKRYVELNNFPKHWINFKNGFFDVKENKLYPHDPKYLSLNQIPYEFPENEPKGDNIKAFIDYAIPDKSDQEMFFQYAGLCLTVDSSFQRFLVLTGAAGTGKSILIRIVENMVGSENASHISLQQLNERFFPASLLGKTLNSCADIPSKAMEAVDGIKKATGEDQLYAEKKGKDGFSFNSYAKLLFSANEIPINIEEKSEAVYRRMMIIRVDRKPEKPDTKLWEKIEPEINYVIYHSLQALKRVYENGNISVSNNSEQSVLELYESADNVLAFINDCLNQDPKKRIKQSELYQSYLQYCTETGRNPLSAYGFNKNLRNKGYKNIKISGYPYFTGLCYKDTEFIKIDNETELPFE